MFAADVNVTWEMFVLALSVLAGLVMVFRAGRTFYKAVEQWQHLPVLVDQVEKIGKQVLPNGDGDTRTMRYKLTALEQQHQQITRTQKHVLDHLGIDEDDIPQPTKETHS